MPLAPLATPEDLEGQPGGPFITKRVTSAGETVRRLAGWHIAPPITETLTLDSPGGQKLWLPTRHVTNVTAVRDASGDTPVPITGWRWSAGGMIELRSGCFPCGYRVVEVDLTHGYEECPADLFPVIADRTNRRIVQESLASRAVTFGLESDGGLDSVLNTYKLGPRP